MTSEAEGAVSDAANEAVTEFERVLREKLKVPLTGEDRIMLVDVLFAMGSVMVERSGL